MIKRIISSALKKTAKSILLLGPRQTGKSTLIKSLDIDLNINFADEEVYFQHSKNYGLLRDLIEKSKAKKVFIDEVQRLPNLLNTVQALIDDEPSLKFYLTGSSARKLKKGGANLLPGRVLNFSMGPVILKELDYKFTKEDLSFGFLPGVYSELENETKKSILQSYSANYVSEEIKAEALVKDLPAFSRFLSFSSELVGGFIDYSKLSQRIKVSRHQVPRYFEIFEDTMIAKRIFPAFDLIEEFDLIKHPKFYFFDVGVLNGLINSFDLSSKRLGLLCEQVVYQQLFHSAEALRKKIDIHTFRTRGGLEIDFLVKLESDTFAVEVKTTDRIIESDVRPLLILKKSQPKIRPLVIHFGKTEQKINGVWCLPLGSGLKEVGL